MPSAEATCCRVVKKVVAVIVDLHRRSALQHEAGRRSRGLRGQELLRGPRAEAATRRRDRGTCHGRSDSAAVTVPTHARRCQTRAPTTTRAVAWEDSSRAQRPMQPPQQVEVLSVDDVEAPADVDGRGQQVRGRSTREVAVAVLNLPGGGLRYIGREIAGGCDDGGGVVLGEDMAPIPPTQRARRSRGVPRYSGRFLTSGPRKGEGSLSRRAGGPPAGRRRRRGRARNPGR